MLEKNRLPSRQANSTAKTAIASGAIPIRRLTRLADKVDRDDTIPAVIMFVLVAMAQTRYLAMLEKNRLPRRQAKITPNTAIARGAMLPSIADKSVERVVSAVVTDSIKFTPLYFYYWDRYLNNISPAVTVKSTPQTFTNISTHI